MVVESFIEHGVSAASITQVQTEASASAALAPFSQVILTRRGAPAHTEEGTA